MKVFISSTYEDLKSERGALLDLTARLKATFVGMEIFPAAVTTPKETALREIAECDVAVFIIGFRYGTVDLEANKSIVEIEYEVSAKMNKEILVYFKDEKTPITLDQIDFSNLGRLEDFKKILDTQHHHKKFRNPDELTTLVALDLVDRFMKRGAWLGVSRESFDHYRNFWSRTLGIHDTVLILEVGKYAAHKGEVELAKNINGVMGISKLIPALSQLGIRVTVEAAAPGIPLDRNLILDGSHTGNSVTKWAVEHRELSRKLVYRNEHTEDLFTRWLQNVRKRKEVFRTEYQEGDFDFGGAGRKKRILYDYGFLACVRNPFGPLGNCIIASGNHGAGTYACMSVLSRPELLERIVEQVGNNEFQAVIGIQCGELFRLGDPVIHKVVQLQL